MGLMVPQPRKTKMLMQQGTVTTGANWSGATIVFPVPYKATPLFVFSANNWYQSEENWSVLSVSPTEAKVSTYSSSGNQPWFWQAYGEVEA